MKKILLILIIILCFTVHLLGEGQSELFPNDSTAAPPQNSGLDINYEFYSWDTEYVDYYLNLVSNKIVYIDNYEIGKFSDDGQYFIFAGTDDIFIFEPFYIDGSIARGIDSQYEGTSYNSVEFARIKETGGIITLDDARKVFTFAKTIEPAEIELEKPLEVESESTQNNTKARGKKR